MTFKLLLSALALALLAPTSFAQTPCHAENDGNAFRDNVSLGGPNLSVAIRFVAPADLAVTSIEVFTGEGAGTNSLGLWSHDGAANRPGVDLGTGSWSMSGANSWQGAALSSTTSLDAGSTYWVVWGCQNGAQSSIQDGGSVLGQVYCASFDGGLSWGSTFQFTDTHWKFRLYCGQGPGVAYCFGDGTGSSCPCANTGGVGEGCANSSGAGGLLQDLGSASVGADDLAFSASQLLPAQPALLFAGGNAVGGGAGTLFGDGLRCAGQGVVRLGVQVPDATGAASWGPGLVSLGGWSSGETRHFQGWYRDPGGPCAAGFNLTQGVQVTFVP